MNGRVLYERGGTTIPPSITPLERFEVDLMDFKVSGSGEVPNPTRPEKWAPREPGLHPGDTNNFETGCWLMQQRLQCLEEQEFDFYSGFSIEFETKCATGFTGSGRKISSGMRSIRYEMRRPSPGRRPGRLFPVPLPLIPPFPVEMLPLNWRQRSRKVFWKLQNRPV